MFVATVALKADAQKSGEWIIDSGASRHMTFERGILYNYKEFEIPEPVGLGDGRTVTASGAGKVKVTSHMCNGKKIIGWMLMYCMCQNSPIICLVFMQQL